MLLDPKKRKIWHKTFDGMFIVYLEHNVTYRFLVFKSNIIKCNTIITNLRKLLDSSSEPMSKELKRSKRQRKETSFGYDFYTYLVKDDRMSFSKATSALEVKLWEQAISIKIDLIKKNYMETIRGFTQKLDVDYFDTFALVSRISSIRTLIALASMHKLVIH
ncbi:hypothetical protein CR513_21734, partial [Mucuna pruriens]